MALPLLEMITIIRRGFKWAWLLFHVTDADSGLEMQLGRLLNLEPQCGIANEIICEQERNTFWRPWSSQDHAFANAPHWVSLHAPAGMMLQV